MPDYQRVVEDVRSAMQTHSEESLDFVITAAENYTAACVEINERLLRCADLLKRGLRGEALHRCEIEPNLLDAVATLDIADLQRWNEILFGYGRRPAPPLLMDAAAQLNEAYSVEQPLADLMRRHRLLALGLGPLRARIEVLQRLAELDRDNPVWLADLPAFEQERQTQLRLEAAEAQQRDDLPRLVQIETEAAQGPWITPPSQALLKSLAAVRAGVARQQSCREAERLVPELNQALDRGDAEGGRQVRQQWYAALQTAQLPPDNPLLARAARALNWLAADDARQQQAAQHAQAVAALEQALARRTPARQLTWLYNRATAGGLEVSFETRKAYQQRLAEIQRAAFRRRLLAAAAALLVLAAAGVAVVATIEHYRYIHLVETTAKNLQRLVDADNLPEARQMLKAQPPDIAAQPAVAALAKTLAQKEETEQQRADAFDTLVADFRDQVRHNPFNRDWLNPKLDEVTLKAVRPKEKELAAALKDDWRSELKKAVQQNDADALKELARIEFGIEALKKVRRDDSSESRARALRSDLDRLRQQTDVSDAVRDKTRCQKERLDGVKALWDQGETVNRLVKDVTAALGTIDDFSKALAALKEASPDQPTQSDLAQVVQEAPLWTGVEAWNKLTDLLRSRKLTELAPDAAAERITQIKEVLEKYGTLPPAAAVRDAVPYLEAIAARVKDDQRIEEAPRRLFADKLMSQVWLIVGNDGTLYYTLDAPVFPAGNGLGMFHYLVDFSMATRTVNLRTDDVKGYALAGHTALAGEVSPLLTRLRDATWEDTFCKIFQLTAEAKRIDPILQLILLDKLLNTGCQGSRCLAVAFQEQVTLLGKCDFDRNTNWLDPGNTAAPAARAAARALLADLSKDLNAAVKQAEEEHHRLAGRRLGQTCRWIGWLRRDDAAWQCQTRPDQLLAASDEGADLVVVEKASDGPTLTRIGHVRQQRPHLADPIAANPGSGEPPLSPGLRQGRPVYLVLPDSP